MFLFLFLFGTALMAAWGPHFQAGLGHICDVGANNKKIESAYELGACAIK